MELSKAQKADMLEYVRQAWNGSLVRNQFFVQADGKFVEIPPQVQVAIAPDQHMADGPFLPIIGACLMAQTVANQLHQKTESYLYAAAAWCVANHVNPDTLIWLQRGHQESTGQPAIAVNVSDQRGSAAIGLIELAGALVESDGAVLCDMEPPIIFWVKLSAEMGRYN